MNLVEELRDEAKWCETRSTPGWQSAGELYIKAADDLDAMAKRIVELDAKWRDYETNYILPVFKWAEEMKIDLHALVAAGGGNCVELFFRELRRRITELEQIAENEGLRLSYK